MQAFSLSNEGILKIEGVGAKSFLQGQLTVNIENISAGQGLLAAHCQSQGRIISLFYIAYFQDAYYLILPKNMVTIARLALQKYAVFFKVTMTESPSNMCLLGMAENEASSESDVCDISLPHSRRFIRLYEQSKIADHTLQSEHLWKAMNIAEKIPAVYPETTGKLLPHDLDLHLVNAIDFNKGCYTGQEIIARMHYRGKPKNHLYHATLYSPTTPVIGADIFYLDNDLRTAGVLIDVCESKPHHYSTLCVIEEKQAKNHRLFLQHDPASYFTLTLASG